MKRVEDKKSLPTGIDEGGSPGRILSGPLRVSSVRTRQVFDYLVESFIEDYMRTRYALEVSGWRSLGEAARETGIPARTMYAKRHGFGDFVNELLRKGVVEMRVFPGKRGRGGEASKFRVAYDRRPVQTYVDDLALGKQQSEEPLQALEKLRVAVLPIANMSPDPSDSYFADGMTEEFISALSKIRELRVISRTSVMRYRDTSKSTNEIARELGVGSLLEGSVRKSGNSLRISVQLIDTTTDEHLWSRDYDRKLDNVFAVQKEIAIQVADALKVRLMISERSDIERASTSSTKAYTLYLKGRYYWNERTREGIEKATKYFEEAIELDPRSSLVYSGLSDCYLIRSDRGWMHAREAVDRAIVLAAKALEFDDRSAEGHASLALALTYRGDFRPGETEIVRAIELKPSYATAHQRYGLILHLMDRQGEAYERCRQALDLDPFSLAIGMNLANYLSILGRPEEALVEYRRLLELYPNSPDLHHWLGVYHLYNSMPEEAIAEEKKAVGLSRGDMKAKCDLAFAYGFSGKKKQALEILAELQRLPVGVSVPSAFMAFALLAVGQNKEAFDLLNQATEDCDPWVFHFKVDPWYAKFRKGSRWVELSKKLRPK